MGSFNPVTMVHGSVIPKASAERVRHQGLGLTGGIGSGKSTAAVCFERLGWACFSADREVARLLVGDAEVVGQVAARFGSAVVVDGVLQRGALARIVFADLEALGWLESLLHPLVLTAEDRFRKENHGKWCVFEIPLLFEKSLESRYGATVTLHIDEVTQRARLRARGLEAGDFERRIALQLPSSAKIERADLVLLNSGSPDFLARQVEWIHRRLAANRSPQPQHAG